MNNGIFDFRKKIAFAAALLFVSHTLYSLPAAEAGAAVTPTPDMHPTAAQEENTPEEEEVDYTVTFTNHTVSKNDYAQLVYKMFGGDVRHRYDDWSTTGTIKAKAGADPKNERMYVGDYIYMRNTGKEAELGEHNIVLDTYAVVNNTGSFANELEFSGLIDGSYCLLGGEITVRPKDFYVINGSADDQTIRVDRNINLEKKNYIAQNDTYDLAVTAEQSFSVGPRMFTLDTGDESISILMNNFPFASGSRFRWKDARSILLVSPSAARMTVYCGDKSAAFDTFNGWFSFSNVVDNEELRYGNNAAIQVRTVPSSVTAVFNYEGDEERSGKSQSVDGVRKDNVLCFRVPYLEDGNYYLAEYDYGGQHSVDINAMYDDIVADERFLYIPANDSSKTITLTYRKFDRIGDYDFDPETDISKRSEHCYTIEGNAPSSTLMTFPPDFGSSTIVYDYFGGTEISGFDYGKYPIDSTRKSFIVNKGIISDPHFFMVKDILRKGSSVVNALDGSICFYIDKSAPSSAAKDADTDQPVDSSKWTGRDGLRVALDVTDTEECPLTDGDDDEYKRDSVREVYDKYINAPTVNKQEIRSIIVGDYRFDRPEGGWASEGAVDGYVETAAVRAAEKKAIDYLRNTDLVEMGLVTGEQGDSDYYYKKLLRNGICDDIEKKLSPELAELDDELDTLQKRKDDIDAEHELELAKEAEERDAVLIEKLESNGTSVDNQITAAKKAYDAAAKEVTAFRSAADGYRKAVAGAKSSYKSVPSLSFDEEGQRFIITLNASDAYKNSVFSEEMYVYAVDNSGNEGNSEERADKICINYDGAAPVIKDNSIGIGNSVSREGKDGVKEYILRDGSDIFVSVNDEYHDDDGGRNGIGVDSVMWKLGDVTHGMFYADGAFRGRVSGSDINGRDLVSDIIINSKDRLNNESRLSSMDAAEKFRVIIDSTRPESNISDISDEDKQRRDDDNKIWYGAYSDVKIQIESADPNPDICSGLDKIIITINGRATELKVASHGIDAETLAKGDYYISLDEDTAEDSFMATLRCRSDQSFMVPIGTGYYRLGRRADGSYDSNSPDIGAVSVKFRAVDTAGLESSEHEQKVFLDLEDPHIAGVFFGNDNIIRSNESLRFTVFSADETQVRIAIGGNVPLSGIKSLTVALKNTDGTKFADVTAVKTGAREWTAAIPADFRGTVTVRAESNVLRYSEAVETYGIITESGSQHEKDASASIILPSTSHRDQRGNPLYSDDINIGFEVSDKFSGLSSITVTPSDGSSDTVTINGGSFENGRVNWSSDGTYYNLITGMKGSMSFSGNTNGNRISLGYSDNAGHGSDNAAEAEFSIDKTNPKVDVAFADQNSGGDQDNKSIFRSSRRAVVTVTERNFSESLVNVTVNGTERTLRWELSGGTAGTDTAQYSAPVDFEDDGVYTLAVKCTDLAGRSSNEFTSDTFTIDKTAPVLNVGVDKSIENDHYYHDNMIMTLRITDNNFDASRINVSGTLNGSAEGFPKLSDWVKVGSDHVASIRFDRDGEYSLSVSGRDMAGNTLDSYSSRFCIDTTAPKIAIGEVEKANGGDEIRPRIRFNDTNLDRDSIKITLEGAKRGKDLPYDGQFVETSEGLDYVFDNFPARKNYDDIYTIKASAKDNADNKLDTQLRFSVNRFGSTFEFDEDTRKLANKYISKEQDIILTEYNVDKHSDKSSVFITKDSEMIELTEGTDYSVEHVGGGDEWSEYKYTIYAKNFESDARYTVSVHSVDAAGNINISDSDKKQAELSFFIDKTKPLCIPLNISENSAYKGENYTVRLSVTDNIDLKDVEVFIDGNRANSRLDNDECIFDIPNSSRAQNIKIVLTDMADNEIEYTYRNVLVTTNVARLLVRKTWVKVTGAAAVLLAGAGAVLIRKRKKRLL